MFLLNYKPYKRFLDLLISTFFLILLLIPLLLISLIIRIKLGPNILFTQLRPGLNSIPFKLIKFRSMSIEFDANGALLEDRFRLNKFGKFLRSTSIDELPELWNVIKGDMSLVGPRPLLMEYLPLYSQEQRRRHEVRPGITGLAQVSGRNTLGWNEKFNLDLWYVDNHNILLDIKILWLTVCKVFLRDGINAQGEVTASRFTGNSGEKKDQS